MYEPKVATHGESRAEYVAGAKANTVTVVGVPLARAGGIGGPPICWHFVFEFLLVRVSPVDPGAIADVVVNASAILIRVVSTKAGGAPVRRYRIVDRLRVEVDQLLPDRIDSIHRVGKIVVREWVPNQDRLSH